MITPRPATPIHNQGPRRIRFTPDILSGRPRTPQFGQGALQEPALAVEIEGERRPERLPRPAARGVFHIGPAPHTRQAVPPDRGDPVLVTPGVGGVAECYDPGRLWTHGQCEQSAAGV